MPQMWEEMVHPKGKRWASLSESASALSGQDDTEFESEESREGESNPWSEAALARSEAALTPWMKYKVCESTSHK